MVAITSPAPARKAKALSLISTFNTGSAPIKSAHYPNVTKSMMYTYLRRVVTTGPQTANTQRDIIHQGKASLCGPAALLYSVFRDRPDQFVQIAIDLYMNGKAKFGTLELKSSHIAKNYTLASPHMHYVEWMLLSSVIHNYDTPKEQFDGITLPSTLAGWFRMAGYADVLDDTTMAKPDVTPEGFKRLIQAQNAYSGGYNVCLLIYMDLFIPFSGKQGFPWHGFAEHWVVLNAPIQIKRYNPKTKTYMPPVTLTGAIANTIAGEIKKKYNNAVDDDDSGELTEDIAMLDKIIVNAFTWGKNQSQAQSKLSSSHEVRLDYFLSGYFGYVKAKR